MPRCFTSQVIPFYNDRRPRSGLKLASEAAAKQQGGANALQPAFARRRKVSARPAATRAYKMNVLSCFSFSKLQSPNDEQSALEWVGIRGDITLGIGRGQGAEWSTNTRLQVNQNVK